MRIALLQLNSTIGDFAANREKLLAAYTRAVAGGAAAPGMARGRGDLAWSGARERS